MLSQTTEYALRAVVLLAHRAPTPQTTEEIAAVTGVPGPYLAKVLQGLSRAGLVNSQRGVRGGFSLARAPDELTLLDVVNAVEPIKRITTCPMDIQSHGVELCPLHKRLDDAIAAVEQVLGTTPLVQVLGEPSRSVPLCEIPETPKQTPEEMKPTGE